MQKRVNEENIPQCLKDENCWVLHRKKIPYRVNGTPAKSNSPETWGSFAEVMAVFRQGKYDGIGFVFSTASRFAGVDLDKCINEAGEIEDWAYQIIKKMDSYTEISPSGRGVHILCYADAIPEGNRKGKVEIYRTGRYFTVTGNVYGNPKGIEERQEILEAVHRQHLGKEQITPDLWTRIFQAKNGQKARMLFMGDISEYRNDHSAADQALCNIIAFYTRDPSEIDRAFRQSRLYRQKWDEKRGVRTYGEITIESALRFVGEKSGEQGKMSHRNAPNAPKNTNERGKSGETGAEGKELGAKSHNHRSQSHPPSLPELRRRVEASKGRKNDQPPKRTENTENTHTNTYHKFSQIKGTNEHEEREGVENEKREEPPKNNHPRINTNEHERGKSGEQRAESGEQRKMSHRNAPNAPKNTNERGKSGEQWAESGELGAKSHNHHSQSHPPSLPELRRRVEASKGRKNDQPRMNTNEHERGKSGETGAESEMDSCLRRNEGEVSTNEGLFRSLSPSKGRNNDQPTINTNEHERGKSGEQRAEGGEQGKMSHRNAPNAPKNTNERGKSGEQPPLVPPCKKQGGYEQSDIGNAYRFRDTYYDCLRYLNYAKSWYYWDGVVWQEDKEQMVMQKGIQLVEELLAEAEKISDSREKEKAVKYALSCQNQRKLVPMLTLSSSLMAMPENIDNSRYLTCENLTIDLQTNDFLTPDPKHYITQKGNVAYSETAECPNWDNFLKMIFCNDEELIRFVQKAVGYSLTALIDERCFFILYGSGRNGKSVFIETIADLLGGYAAGIPTEAIFNKSEGAGNDIAVLKGIRFAYCSEGEEGEQLAEARIKKLTGGDTIKARKLYQDFTDFKPQFKLWYSTNPLPRIKGTDNGIWDRVRIIPFKHRISDEEQKPLSQVHKTLRSEKSGILNWALEGLRFYHKEGMNVPEVIRNVLLDYRTENDLIGIFIEEECQLDSLNTIDNTVLYQAYNDWSCGRGERPLSQKRFTQKMKSKNFDQQVAGLARKKQWLGIALNGRTITAEWGKDVS